MVGATIQRELYVILPRFPLHKYALAAYISKMYKQDKSMQAHLSTITYGTASALFLAIFVLSKIYAESHPVASDVIPSDFYVHDITGKNSMLEMEVICKEVTNVLKLGCFCLAKWATNHTSSMTSHF